MLTLLTLRPAKPDTGYEDAGIISLAMAVAGHARRLRASLASGYWAAHRKSAGVRAQA